MLLNEFYENLMTFWSNLLTTPLNFFTAIVTFIFVIIQTIAILFSMFMHYLNMALAFVPNFLKPFLALILVIRFFKFISSKHNSSAVHSASIDTHGGE